VIPQVNFQRRERDKLINIDDFLHITICCESRLHDSYGRWLREVNKTEFNPKNIPRSTAASTIREILG
jgi:hypothetical protein